jgi:hypothetical protein
MKRTVGLQGRSRHILCTCCECSCYKQGHSPAALHSGAQQSARLGEHQALHDGADGEAVAEGHEGGVGVQQVDRLQAQHQDRHPLPPCSARHRIIDRLCINAQVGPTKPCHRRHALVHWGTATGTTAVTWHVCMFTQPHCAVVRGPRGPGEPRRRLRCLLDAGLPCAAPHRAKVTTPTARLRAGWHEQARACCCGGVDMQDLG